METTSMIADAPCILPERTTGKLKRGYNSGVARRLFKQIFHELLHEINGTILDHPQLPNTIVGS